MAANNRTFFDLDDYVDDDVSFGGGEDEGAAARGTVQNKQIAPPNYKDQTREASIPVAEAFAVGESQLADEELQQQRLEEEQARLEEQQARLEEQRHLNQERQARFQAEQARLEEQRQLNQERQARLRLERQMAEAEQARQQAEQARLEAERRLAALQKDNSSPVPYDVLTAAASDNQGTTPVTTNTAAEHEEETRKSNTKRWIMVGAALLLVALAAVGGICHSSERCSTYRALPIIPIAFTFSMILVGTLAGGASSQIFGGSDYGILANVLIGITGAFIFGHLLIALIANTFGYELRARLGAFLGAIPVALIGAILFLRLAKLFKWCKRRN